MLFSVNLIAILAPIIIVQYGLAIFCLLKLVFLDLPKKKFFLWNFFILIVVGVGVITFLVCYFGFRDKVFPRGQEGRDPFVGSDGQSDEPNVQESQPSESTEGQAPFVSSDEQNGDSAAQPDEKEDIT